MKIYPKKYIIYGWENPRSIENVISIMKGLIDENKIPPVVLQTFDGGLSFEIECYDMGVYLASGKGGHHRLIGANLLDCRLGVIINSFDEKKEGIVGIPRGFQKIEIQNIELKSDPVIYWRSSRDYPLPSIQDFFTKYKEINKALKYGKKDYSFTKRGYEELLKNLKEEEIPF